MTPTQPVVTTLCILLNLCLVGSAFSLPEVELPSDDVPSFYWAQHRFGRVSIEGPDGDIVEENAIAEWKALISLQQMRVRVSDVWSQLSYDGRYHLVRGLGEIAARKGYSLMVVDRSNTVLATYECRGGYERDEPEPGESESQYELSEQDSISEQDPVLDQNPLTAQDPVSEQDQAPEQDQSCTIDLNPPETVATPPPRL